MIAIADYGLGNLRSVQKAFEFQGFECIVSSDVNELEKANGLVLPGVGAFSDAVDNLKSSGLFEFSKDWIKKDKPFLGICLGLQLLFEYSEEAKDEVKGLGVFEGGCKLFPKNLGLKVPQIGWNSINVKNSDIPILKGIKDGEYVYFVHSYYVDAKNKEEIVATAEYGVEFACFVGRGSVFATQFHPEKSGKIGLKMIDNFAKYAISR